MNNVPNKIIEYLGYNNLSTILNQERKHWLLKTDKKLQIKDKTTGDMFQGQIENLGSDIIIETEEMLNNHPEYKAFSFVDQGAKKAMGFEPSSFTQSMEVNGFGFIKILSSIYQYAATINSDLKYKHYKIKLIDCHSKIIPFSASGYDSQVFADRWICTEKNPVVMLMDDMGNYTIEVPLNIDGMTNVKFYYPLNESIQPLPITSIGDNTYTIGAVDNDCFIGYPLIWFTCDETNLGPKVVIGNNTSENGKQLSFLGNKGDEGMYNVKMYFGVDGTVDATPTDVSLSEYKIVCSPVEGSKFIISGTNENVKINPSSIGLLNKNTDVLYNMDVSFPDGESSYITLEPNSSWNFESDNLASIALSIYNQNCRSLGKNALLQTFNIHLDNSIPFFSSDKSNQGFAGVRMSSTNDSSDINPKYPHDLNKWEGLPEWMNELGTDVPEHTVVYAIRNTPEYNEIDPSSRQTAGLILDPGLRKTDDSEELSTDEKGRVYVISNDDLEYRNNAKEKDNNSVYAKPDRTAARICDIPVSVMQLTGVEGLAPTSVVDKRYVRNEACFTEEDQNRIYNVLADKWVRPDSYDENHKKIFEYEEQNGDKYVFNSLDILNKVSLRTFNNFCKIENMNAYVNAEDVSVSSIINGGEGYHRFDTGKIVVGGFSFTYEVQAVDESGSVTDVLVGSNSEYDINLANFDMTSGTSGISATYGTAPDDPTNSGRGLQIRFLINNYESLLPRKGDILDGLFAFVRENDGLWLYEYDIIYDREYNEGSWTKKILVSPFEESHTNKKDGNVSLTDAYMSSVIPLYSEITVARKDDRKPNVNIKTFKTPSFINVIDETCTPVTPSSQSDIDVSKLTMVDINKWRCDGIIRVESVESKDFKSVLKKLKSLNVLRYDSYVIWRFITDTPSVTAFEYGIIYRSLNNYLSTDSTSILPANNMMYDSYVHSNANTMVTWNPSGGTGPMVWVFDPDTNIHETYRVHPSTQELEVNRNQSSWNDVDFGDLDIRMYDSDDKLMWNIMTNAKIISNSEEYIQPTSLIIGSSRNVADIYMKGMWTLAFPSITSYKLTNITDGQEFTPIQMQVLHGADLGKVGDVIDKNGGKVNIKTLIVNETEEGISLLNYNEKTEQWESFL